MLGLSWTQGLKGLSAKRTCHFAHCRITIGECYMHNGYGRASGNRHGNLVIILPGNSTEQTTVDTIYFGSTDALRRLYVATSVGSEENIQALFGASTPEYCRLVMR